jgi:hypothetical protein
MLRLCVTTCTDPIPSIGVFSCGICGGLRMLMLLFLQVELAENRRLEISCVLDAHSGTDSGCYYIPHQGS